MTTVGICADEDRYATLWLFSAMCLGCILLFQRAGWECINHQSEFVSIVLARSVVLARHLLHPLSVENNFVHSDTGRLSMHDLAANAVPVAAKNQ